MTVASTTSKVSYAGNGSTTAFTVPFYFLANTDLLVTYRNNSTGTETVKTLTTDYTVTGAGVSSGGTVTMLSAPASGITVVIQRSVPLTQNVDYQPNDPFPANTHEMALDKLTMEAQQLQEQISRSIKLSTTNTMTSTEFTIGATDRANKVLGFDTAGELAVTQELGTYRGVWASGVAYKVRDLIKDSSNANIYFCITAHTSSGAVPISTNTDAAKWSLIVDAATATSSATAAAASASAAATSATNAASSATSASTSASTATTQASSATTSASNAASSASSASTSASNAASSATSASTSASSASTSATNAANSATSAATSATNAASSATSASGSASTATTQAAAASASASSASTSATNAAASATSASTSATTATTQASTATTQASNASTSATNAASSATAAAASAAAAAASAASGLYRQVIDKSANYTATSSDGGSLIRVTTTSGAITITLPLISTVTDGYKIAVVKWTSDANVVNVNRSGSDTINGATSAQIGSQYSQLILVADFETNQWFASQSGLGATNMNVDVFSGNGSTTAFTLTADPGTKNNTDVFISGVHQAHSTYSISGTTLTFSTAPGTGTSNIEVCYGTPLAIGTPSDATVTTAKIVDANVTAAKLGSDAPLGVSDKTNSSTGYFALPSGTTAQRPASPSNGMLRYNTTLAVFEWYNGNIASWQPVFQPAGYYVQVFLCAGGGGGGGGESNPGGDGGAGGGGGGLVNCGSYVNTLNTYTVTVGAGGAGGIGSTSPGSNTMGVQGTDSFFNNIVAFGGGGGGDGNGGQAGPGGSGGGAANEYNTLSYGGGGVWSQGNKGGDCPASTVNRGAPGGGGAGSAGTDKSSGNGANGGAPAYNGIAGGQNLYYAGGGGGGPCGTASAGSGGNGLGIGGNGGTSTSAPGTGTTNRGGGGGGGVGHNVSSSYTNGANGGSGQVIICYQNSTQRGSGGTVTSFTRNGVTTWVHTFNSSGTFTA